MAHPSPLETETEAAPHTPTLADIALAEAEVPYTWESCDNSEYFATPTHNMESVSDSEGSAFESWKRRRSVEQDVSVEQDGVPVDWWSGPPNWAQPSVAPPVARVVLSQIDGHLDVVVRTTVGGKQAANLPNGTVCDLLQTQGEHCQIHEPDSKLTGWVKRQNTLPFPPTHAVVGPDTIAISDQPLTPTCEPGTPTLVRLPGAGAANPLEKPLYLTGAEEAEQEGKKKFDAEAAVKEMRKRGVYSPVVTGYRRDTEYL